MRYTSKYFIHDWWDNADGHDYLGFERIQFYNVFNFGGASFGSNYN